MEPTTTAEAKKPKGGADGCLDGGNSLSEATLMRQALTRENLQRAWDQVRANHGAPGVDGMTVEDFPAFVRSPQWAQVKEALAIGTYLPQAVRRVYIPKDGGGERPLGIPTVLDRLIQQALAQVNPTKSKVAPLIFNECFFNEKFPFRCYCS